MVRIWQELVDLGWSWAAYEMHQKGCPNVPAEKYDHA